MSNLGDRRHRGLWIPALAVLDFSLYHKKKNQNTRTHKSSEIWEYNVWAKKTYLYLSCRLYLKVQRDIYWVAEWETLLQLSNGGPLRVFQRPLFPLLIKSLKIYYSLKAVMNNAPTKGPLGLVVHFSINLELHAREMYRGFHSITVWLQSKAVQKKRMKEEKT